MRVFLSWSGPRGKYIAQTFKNWLCLVIQSLEPWISPDIEKGARWSDELSGRLETSKIGIVCLTKDSFKAPWILFEAGALSKVKADHVCTFLFDLKPAEVGYPLAQFQHTENTKEELFKLIITINELAAKAKEKPLPESVLKTSFDTYWKSFAEQLEKTPPLKDQGKEPLRTESDMLQEVLATVRTMQYALLEAQENINKGIWHQGSVPSPNTAYGINGPSGLDFWQTINSAQIRPNGLPVYFNTEPIEGNKGSEAFRGENETEKKKKTD